jgi:hypothetical protein
MALRDTILELAPHYVAMLVLVTAVLVVVRLAVGNLGFWVEFVIIVAVVFVYPLVVRRLGYAPDAWKNN